MNNKVAVHTEHAPKAIGCYSQAIVAGNTVYISGQIPLDPETMEIVAGDIRCRIRRVFENLKAVAEASGGDLEHVVKLNVYLLTMNDFKVLNEVMAEYFIEPYPARAAIAVIELPKGVDIEMEAVMVLPGSVS